MSQSLAEALAIPAEAAARCLLGCELVRTLPDDTVLRTRIVETEAYDQSDPASHSFRGPTARTAAMFGPPGRAYIYFTYGMHYCFNIVTGPSGYGAGVLIRAVEPLSGLEIMHRNRPKATRNKMLTNGPAKLCYALQIDKSLYGHNLTDQPLTLRLHPQLSAAAIVKTTRIGIKQATEAPWRFYICNNAYISKQ